MLLSSTVRDDNATMTCDLTNPDLHGQDGALTSSTISSIFVVRAFYGVQASNISQSKFRRVASPCKFEISFRADFADLFEVRGAQRGNAARTTERDPTVKCNFGLFGP
jgi:hypothetical protein